MNRRFFFKLVGAAAPALFLPKLIKPAWKLPRPGPVEMFAVLNPAYVTARYEWFIIDIPPAYDELILKNLKPIRWNHTVDGKIVSIPPFIMKPTPSL
jgi:hypothetical protein